MVVAENVPIKASRSHRILADLGLFYAAGIWGATFFVVKDALSDISPVILVAYRFLMAGSVMLIYLLARKRPLFKDIAKGLLLAIILWALYVTQTIGLGITTASNSGFITGLFVAFVPLFLLTVFRRRPTLMEVLASAVALLGLWILTGGLTQVNAGDLLTLLTAMAYALHVLLSDRYMKAGVDPYIISCQQFVIIGLLSLLTGFLFDLPFSYGSAATLWTIVFLALFPTLSAFVIQMLAQKVASPLRVSLVFAFEPVFAGLFAWTLGGEIFIMRKAFGGLLIFFALIISGLPLRRKPYSDNQQAHCQP